MDLAVPISLLVAAHALCWYVQARARGTYLMIGLSRSIDPDTGNKLAAFHPGYMLCGRSRSSRERVSATVRPEGSVLPIPGRPRWFCQCKLTCQFAQCIAISGHADVARASARDTLLVSRTRDFVISTITKVSVGFSKEDLKICCPTAS